MRKNIDGKCAHCTSLDTVKRAGQFLCLKHLRIKQMRDTARADGKYSPSREELEGAFPESMACRDCGELMTYRRTESGLRVATLQHYREGEIAVVCNSCNSRHQHHHADTYREFPKGQKFCPACKEVKEPSEYYTKKRGPGSNALDLNSSCKECARAISRAKYHRDIEQSRTRQRQRRTTKKEQAT